MAASWSLSDAENASTAKTNSQQGSDCILLSVPWYLSGSFQPAADRPGSSAPFSTSHLYHKLTRLCELSETKQKLLLGTNTFACPLQLHAQHGAKRPHRQMTGGIFCTFFSMAHTPNRQPNLSAKLTMSASIHSDFPEFGTPVMIVSSPGTTCTSPTPQ